MKNGAALLKLYRSLDDRLAKTGQHVRSPWWDAAVERWCLHPTATRFVGRVGRGGIKSGCARRVAEAVMLAGQRVPSNERHFFAWVSENVDEATQRPRQVEADFKALGIPCTRVGNTVELDDLPIGFKAFACRIGAVSGFRCIGFVCDEEAKWRSDDGNANPAGEVVGSLRAMTVTHPDAPEWHISSPLGLLGFFQEQFALGDTDFQVTAHAASWTANPGISEEQTRRLEPDRRVWLREYAAVPQASVLAALDADAVERAFVPRSLPSPLRAQRVLVLDPSSGRADTWSWGIAGWDLPDTHVRRADGSIWLTPWGEPLEKRDPPSWAPYLSFDVIDGIEGPFWRSTTGDQIADRLAKLAQCLDIRTVIGDQREALMLESAFRKRGLRYVVKDWTATSKPAAVARLRRLLAEDSICFVEHAGMRQQLLGFEERITSSGAFTYGARGSSHDDFAALAVTAMMADEDGDLERSPLRKTVTRGLGQHPISPF